MSSVRGPQNLANSLAKMPQIACACASPSPGGHASRFNAGGWASSPRSSRSTSSSRSRGTRARMRPVSSPVGSSTIPPIPARIASTVMFNKQRALATAGRPENMRVLEQRPRFDADLTVEPRVVAATQQQPTRRGLRDRRDPARWRLGERHGRERAFLRDRDQRRGLAATQQQPRLHRRQTPCEPRGAERFPAPAQPAELPGTGRAPRAAHPAGHAPAAGRSPTRPPAASPPTAVCRPSRRSRGRAPARTGPPPLPAPAGPSGAANWE